MQFKQFHNKIGRTMSGLDDFITEFWLDFKDLALKYF